MNGYSDQTSEDAIPTARPHARRQASVERTSRDVKKFARRQNDAWNVLSDSEDTRQRRVSVRTNNARSASRKRSKNTLRGKDSPVPHDLPSQEESAWIHRDKLAQIEIQEMAEAGIHIRQSYRSSSRAAGAGRSSRSSSRPRRSDSREQMHDASGEESSAQATYNGAEGTGRKRVSTIPAGDEDQHDFDPQMDSEFRSPAEVAQHESTRESHSIRPSTSRIPVSRASPMPVPSNVVGRDSPLPRGENGNGAWSGAGDDMLYAKKGRSGSFGSQVLLDDDLSPRPGSAHDISPQKTRAPGKSTMTSRARKGSATNNTNSRPGSSSNKNQRNSSRSASRTKNRPSTAQRSPPEGEAPWIAAMYKPDPRLPPDQQMLPTHAKRMMQERWENEGKTGTAYDRDLKLLNDNAFPSSKNGSYNSDQDLAYDGNLTGQDLSSTPPVLSTRDRSTFDQPPRSSSRSPDKRRSASPTKNGNQGGGATWPLSHEQGDIRSDSGALRPGTSGGYKITPTIPTSPMQPPQESPGEFGGKKMGAGSTRESEGKKKEGGGCGCCVMM